MFKISDKVIGLQYPNLVPAQVVDIKSDKQVYIKFEFKGRKTTRLVDIEKIRINEQDTNRKEMVQGNMGKLNGDL